MSVPEGFGNRKVEIDPILQNAIFAIGNSDDYELLRLLINEGPKAFSGIKEATELNQTQISRILKKLSNGGLIDRYVDFAETTRRYSFYRSTSLAEELLFKIQELQENENLIDMPYQSLQLYDSDVASPLIASYCEQEGDYQCGDTVDSTYWFVATRRKVIHVTA
jgi:DNA-binding MarR family transcriptional regulator